MKTGSCLCGGVKYQISGEMRPIVACHCSQCRKTSGNFVAATRVAKVDLTFDSMTTLKWFKSSDEAERGFCGTCGSNLFWQRQSGENTASPPAPSTRPPACTLRSISSSATNRIFMICSMMWKSSISGERKRGVIDLDFPATKSHLI